ncbi:uncharacterized protein LOC131558100 isoform X1 [Ammospiza caudacuta]|uniref:uncharacterized protein LOC131558100 isoform X1 n=1 Tax=Ammospiza caudacuta TaxID=2857398 RepID=UPI002739774F|nr:uncharacterized protein LOC131558100 isoform X1 [Ammospiza caudacuta]
MWPKGNCFGYRTAEVPDTPDISGSSKEDVWCTPSDSGSSREVWCTPNISGSRGTESWHPHKVSGNRGREVLERQCEDTDPRKTTAEGSRHISGTSQQLSAYGDQASTMKEMFEMIKEMDKNIKALPEKVIQILHEENEEIEMLKDKNKMLEGRIQKLLAKAMAMHQHSEDINDPLRLSAVLERYEMLRLQEWEKVRCSMPHRWTYEEGSEAIRKVFDACEKDIQQRREDILKVLNIPASNKVMMQDVMKLLRQHYHQNSMVYDQIIQEAAIHIRTENQTQFLLQCCQIYCLLLLQDPPVKAEWRIRSKHLEHVDKKDAVHWENESLLWPIMKRGEEIIVKGVVWDQRKMT